ncbi:MAG: twin-arginine translocase subunit TatC [Parachlamydiaceae bacterium]|nr:twin-arginine translocase subunit TatC [Parachlamydiaceae bacterium]
MFNEESFQGLWGHVEELRKTLLRMLIIILAGFLIVLLFYQSIFSLLSPQNSNESNLSNQQSNLTKQLLQRERVVNSSNKSIFFTLPDGAHIIETETNVPHGGHHNFEIKPRNYIVYEIPVNTTKLLILSPLEGFVLTLKICFWIGFAITSPIWGFLILKFVMPGLRKREKCVIVPFSIASFFAVLIGFSLAYFFTLPFANQYLAAFNSDIGMNAWSLANYYDYTLILFMGHIIAFEICVVLMFLVHFRFLSAEWLKEKRRYMIVFAFVLGALLTPPDVLTQLILALPLVVIYEFAIFYAKIRSKTSDASQYHVRVDC